MSDKFQMADLHYQRGVILEQAGRIAEAVEEYRQALLDNPRLRSAHLALAHYYHRNGLLAKSADALQAAVEIEDDYDPLFTLGTIFIEMERYEDARTAFNACLRMVPLDPLAAFELAYIDYREDKFAEALAAFERLRPLCDDEWQLHQMLGNCHLRLKHYDAALACFGRAMLLTRQDDAIEEMRDSIALVERAREFGGELTLKDRYYVEHGVVCLGTAGDDGLALPELVRKDWTAHDVAVTLERLAALIEARVCEPTALLSLNGAAEPLARTLAVRLEIQLKDPLDLRPDDTALIVGGVVGDPAMIDSILEHVACEVLFFVVAQSWEPRPGATLPDIIGLPVRHATLPWEPALAALRRRGAPRAEQEELIGKVSAELAAILWDLPPEANRAAQVAYYATEHQRAFGG